MSYEQVSQPAEASYAFLLAVATGDVMPLAPDRIRSYAHRVIPHGQEKSTPYGDLPEQVGRRFHHATIVCVDGSILQVHAYEVAAKLNVYHLAASIRTPGDDEPTATIELGQQSNGRILSWLPPYPGFRFEDKPGDYREQTDQLQARIIRAIGECLMPEPCAAEAADLPIAYTAS